MSKYSKLEIAKVKADADIRMIIPGAVVTKYTQDLDCPFCGKAKKFRVSRKKGYNNARCWACEAGFANPLEAWAYYNHKDLKTDFVEVLESVARECGVEITPEETRREEKIRKEKATAAESFCARQLTESGLTVEDVMATVSENGQDYTMSPFRKGTVGRDFMPDNKGDDMLIYYFDLWGRQVTYTAKGTKAQRPYIRARYANPDLHTDSGGTKMKYQTPAGAPVQVYIPEAVRRLFRTKTPIDTLFLQEGEKKAEKACKHGLISVGLQGINSIGSKDQGLIQAIQDIVRTCQVRNVVLVMDSDWDSLSRTLTVGEKVDTRPLSFSGAVIKFKQYMATFHNLGLNVDVWWGHVNANAGGDKGVDDLLTGSLKGREGELMADIDRTMHSHDGRGQWLDVHKITTMSDAKIRDYWHLNDSSAFYAAHKSRLQELPTFKLGNMRYKTEDGELRAVSRYTSEADIYTIERDSKDNPKVVLSYTETFRFLEASGFFRLRVDGEAGSDYRFVHIDDGVIDYVSAFDIRDYVRGYIRTNVKRRIVEEYFNSKLDGLLSDKKLEPLEMKADTFSRYEPDVQRSYYNDGQVEITAEAITPHMPINDVWRSRIVPRKFRRVPLIRRIEKQGDTYGWELSEEGEQCEMLRYLINTSNNHFTADNPRETTEDENHEWMQHVVNKITAIGYLLTDWKYPSDRQAIVVQDHKESEVGQAWGGAGKSVLGTAIGQVTRQFYINGQDFSAADEFILSGVTKATRNIFIDDVKPNFEFKTIFNWVTGPMPVNPRGGSRFTLTANESPKILLTTNHAIKGADEGSVKRRISYVEFSAWYNNDHTPVDDFHHMLFDDWDEWQWTLFDNLMAECVMYYLRSLRDVWHREGRGVVPPPMGNVMRRTLRQFMGETLLQWADEYYDPTGTNLNRRISRNKELWPAFVEFAGKPESYGVSRSNFKKKLLAYAKYKGYDFNPERPFEPSPGKKLYYAEWKKDHPDETYEGGDDKSSGNEYITIYTPEKTGEGKPF